MKKRINLFDKKKRSTLPSLVMDRIMLSGTMLAVLCFGLLIIMIILQFRQQQQKDELLSKKQQMLQTLNSSKTAVAEMGFFQKKKDQMKVFLKDDARFLPYYNLLKEALLPASGSAPILESMNIDKEKATQFTVRFATYEPAYEFLKYMESENFLTNFKELKLEGFSLNSKDRGPESGYELRFTGKFKPIDE